MTSFPAILLLIVYVLSTFELPNELHFGHINSNTHLDCAQLEIYLIKDNDYHNEVIKFLYQSKLTVI